MKGTVLVENVINTVIIIKNWTCIKQNSEVIHCVSHGDGCNVDNMGEQMCLCILSIFF